MRAFGSPSAGISHTAPTDAKNEEQAILDHLKECCDEETDLDIYEMVSFYCARQQKRNTFDWKLLSAMGRAVLMVSTEVAVIGCIWWEDIIHSKAMQEDWRKCAGDDTLFHRTMGALLVLCILVMAIHEYNKGTRSGLHRVDRWMTNKPNGFSSIWIVISRFVNTVVLWMVVLTQTFVVWKEHDAISIVMNSVALWFLLQIDDQFVGDGDYADLKEYLAVYGQSTPIKYEVSTPMTIFIAIDVLLETVICALCLCGVLVGIGMILFCPI